MTDTSQQEFSEPHTNGVMDDVLTDEERSKMRPAAIDADVREMERRKRVEMMINSRLFREELERIIETQMKDGAGPSGLLQQISEMMGPQGARFSANVFKNSNCVVPINDIRGVENMGYAKGEKLLRCKLAAVFRLLDLYGWTQGVGGIITARLNQDQEHFLINPYGLLYHEVTASSLVKVDMQGSVVEQGTTNFGVQLAGFQLHSIIHAARPDIKCIVHIATPSVTAISSMKCGLLPLGQESIVIGDVSTHQYVGGTIETEEKDKIARNLGPINKVMLLTNRGALCCGETVEEAFFNVYNTVLACETQLKLMPVGLENLNVINEETRRLIYEASRKPPAPPQHTTEQPALAEKLEKRWRIGSTEFEALMRMLDNAGFRTGYIYRHPLVKSEPPRPRNDVEVPPAVSSVGYLLEEEELYKQGLWKGGRKGNDRTRWLNSPNVYQKVEILETGTPDPKKITKWVSDGSPTHSSTPVKIESALQFVPKNTNPREFKQIQQQIKDYRRADKISAGPQSHILEGVTWEEAKKMQDATISGTGEQVVLVGAASKGIIQRGFQHNAMVYKTPYAKNPFDAVTDQEIDQYKKEVERKQKGEIYDESQSESEALSSFNISRATHESSTAKSPVQSPVSVTSETEEESRDEPQVLRVETKQVPHPSQPEVVLSDGTCVDFPSGHRTQFKAQTSRNLNQTGADATTQFLNEMRHSEIIARNREQHHGQLSRCSSEYDDAFGHSESSTRLSALITRSTTIAERMRPLLINIPQESHKPNLARRLKTEFLKNYNTIFQKSSESSISSKTVNFKPEKTTTKARTNLFGTSTDNHELLATKVSSSDSDRTENQIIKSPQMKFPEVVQISSDEDIEEQGKDEDTTDVEDMFDETLQVNDTNISYDTKYVTCGSNDFDFQTTDDDNSFETIKIQAGDDTLKFVKVEDSELNSKFTLVDYEEPQQQTVETSETKSEEKTTDFDVDSLECKHETEQVPDFVEDLADNNSKADTETKPKIEEKDIDTKIGGDSNLLQEIMQYFPLTGSCLETNNDNTDEKHCVESQFEDISMEYFSTLSKSVILTETNVNEEASNGNNETYTIEEVKVKGDCLSSADEVEALEEEENDVNMIKHEYKEEEGEKSSFNVIDFKNSPSISEPEATSSPNYEFSLQSDKRKRKTNNKFTEMLDISAESTKRRNVDNNENQQDDDSDDDDEVCMQYPPRVVRQDSITEVINSIKLKFTPMKKLPKIQPIEDPDKNIDTVSRYSLSASDMSLIYSIAPTGCPEAQITSTNQKSNEEYNELFWLDLASNVKRETEVDEQSLSSNNESNNNNEDENLSEHGLDILELPKSTFEELQENDDLSFCHGMSNSTNELLAELDNTEIYVAASNLVDDILYDISCLSFDKAESIDSKTVQDLVEAKLAALRIVKQCTEELISVTCDQVEEILNSSITSVKSNEEVTIIKEIIYHIVAKNPKNAMPKELNNEITGQKNDVCVDENSNETKLDGTFTLNSLSDSENNAEQDVTSDSTDFHDTKSDTSKEKDMTWIVDEMWRKTEDKVEQQLTTLRFDCLDYNSTFVNFGESDQSIFHGESICACLPTEVEIDYSQCVQCLTPITEINEEDEERTEEEVNDDFESDIQVADDDNVRDNECLTCPSLDCMSISYDTREFLLLETTISNEDVCCDLNDIETEHLLHATEYENTSLGRLVSQISLSDILN